MQTGFTARYWNLAMAAAWVKFRKREVVDKFDGPSPESWTAYMMYSTRWISEPLDDVRTLHDALISGRLKAFGHRNAPGSGMALIPSLEWETLTLSPPDAHRRVSSNPRDEPWVNIRVESSEVQKLWRARTDTEGRTRFDWPVIQEIYRSLLQTNPDISQNEMIEEIQQEYQDRFSKDPPARTTIQNKLRTWR